MDTNTNDNSLVGSRSVVGQSYGIGFTIVTLFAASAMFLSYREQQLRKMTTDYFITARQSQSMWRIAWSFFASAMGAWVLFGPANYALSAGWIGLVSYSICAGLPIILIGYLGPVIQGKFPAVLSLTDYLGRRFGPIVQFYALSIMLFNMSISLTAEYTAIGDVFEYLVGTNRIAVAVVNGVLTSVYTAYGGLSVSMVTDQAQGIIAVIMCIIFSIYVACTFSLPSNLPLPHWLDVNNAGLSSIAIMPISLTAATIYSEAFWQRVWAASDSNSLKKGSLIGAVAVIIFVFLFGFYGFAASWAGLSPPSDDANLSLFAILGNNPPTWIWVLLICLGMVMNESAVDSYQNGIVGVISSVLFPKYPVLFTRILAFLLNVPCLIVSLYGLNVVSLFLIGNLVTTTASFPILLGLVDRFYPYCNAFSVMLGCLSSLLSVIVWGLVEVQKLSNTTQDDDIPVNPSVPAGHNGVRYVFYDCYCYEPFVIGLFVSIGGTFLGMGISWVYYRFFAPQKLRQIKPILSETPLSEYILKIYNPKPISTTENPNYISINTDVQKDSLRRDSNSS